MIKKMLCIVITLAILLSGCGQTRETKKDSSSEKEQTKELCVFYDQDNETLINNFEKLYPEYELDKVFVESDIIDQMSRGKIPDLIIADGSTPLMEWYKQGIIQEIGSYYGEDTEIEDEDYFPGALEVGRDEDMLLALPLSAQVQYMTVRQSVMKETTFGNLSEEYTLEEFLNVLQQEYSGVVEKDTMVVSGIPFCYDFIGLLFTIGAITLEEDQVKIDKESFEKLYRICVENCRNYKEDANVSMLLYRNAAIDPRDGDYKAAYWRGCPPQVGVLYAQSVNRQLLDEEIDVFWWPMAGETGRYAAEVTTLGMIGVESENPQAAYEVLRLMMDMPMKEWIQPLKIGHTPVNRYMPIHIENAKELCTYVETTGTTVFRVDSTGNESQVVEKQVWDEELKEKVLNMIDGIQYVYRLDDNVYSNARSVATYEYIDALNVNGATACYEDVLKLLEAKVAVQTPQHDGKYFSFSPAEYMEQLNEMLETLDCTQYLIDLDDGKSSYRNYYIIDTSKPEFVADTFKSQINFKNEDGNRTYDINTKEICGIWACLNETEYENLLQLMTALIMTCDPSLDYKSARGIIDMIPIYDTSKAYEDWGKQPDPYYYNGIGYSIRKYSQYDHLLVISIAAEEAAA